MPSFKDTIKQLIVLKQSSIPTKYHSREVGLPLNSGKIITTVGVRRSGKSTLMEIAINELLSQKVKPQQIVWIGFDDERFSGITDSNLDEIVQVYQELYPKTPVKKAFFFFDEIQRIKNWELFVLRLYKSYCKNIFISGSNADMLSGEMNSALRGWPLEYKVFPLSFKEYCKFKNINFETKSERGIAKIKSAFIEFVQGGAYPEVVLENNSVLKDKLLQGYFNAMIFRDLMERYNLNNSERIKYILKRLMSGITKPASINLIYNDLRSQGRKVSKDELYDIVEKACSMFLLYKVTKYDPSFTRETSSLPKYYCVDTGLRQAVLLATSNDFGKLFENAVFLEMYRRVKENEKLFYFSNRHECDFVLQQGLKVTELVQACWDMADPETERREIAGLKEASRATGCNNMTILTKDIEKIIRCPQGIIDVIPAWKWFSQRCVNCTFPHFYDAVVD